MRPNHTTESASDARVSARIRDELAHLEIHPARADEVLEARDFAAGLIGPDIVTPEGLQMVHERSGAGLFVVRDEEELTGVLAIILLSAQGLAAIEADRFDALSPDPAHVARFDEEPAALYGWGIAATRKFVARRLVDGLSLLANGVIGHMPYFARAATPAGARLLIERIGFRPYPGSQTGLLQLDPHLGGRVAA